MGGLVVGRLQRGQVFLSQRDTLFGAVGIALDDLVGLHATVFGAALVVLDVFPAAGVELAQRDAGGGADLSGRKKGTGTDRPDRSQSPFSVG